MPILGRETDLYPEQLLDNPESVRGGTADWWALYTLPRREKELMRRLRGLSLPFYCPLVAHRTQSRSGRVRVSHLPLFPGYVFLYGDGDDRHRALTSNCVSRCLAVPDGKELTRDLGRIHGLIKTGAPLTPEARLEPGVRVRVRSGPLAGLEGVVIKRSDHERLLVAVNFLQQGASLRVEDSQLERLD